MITAEHVSRPAAAAAGAPLGWGYLMGSLVTAVPAASLADAVEVARHALDAAGPQADGHLHVDLRAHEVQLTLQTLADPPLTRVDLDLAGRITVALHAGGWAPMVKSGRHGIQWFDICIDALDIDAVRPFWRAVLGYDDSRVEADNGLVDPARIGPTLWFQQMDAPRPQRNRIHFDLVVTEVDAPGRIDAALAAGGRLVSDAEAKAFWVLADAEGNEVCVCTWQDRD